MVIAFNWQFWTNVRIAYKDQPDLIKLAETLSDNFDSMYEKEVCKLSVCNVHAYMYKCHFSFGLILMLSFFENLSTF